MQFGFDQKPLSNLGERQLPAVPTDADSFVESLALHLGKLRRRVGDEVREAASALSYVISYFDRDLDDPIIDKIEERCLCQRRHLVPFAELAAHLPADGRAYCDVFVLLVHPQDTLPFDSQTLQLLALVVPRGGFVVVVGLGGEDDANAQVRELELALAGNSSAGNVGFSLVPEPFIATGFSTYRRVERNVEPYRGCSVFRQPRVAILNDHLKTFGGGERSTLQFARAFEQLGFGVDVVAAHNTGISLQELSDVFNIHPVKEWRQREFASNEELTTVLASEGYEVFLNHSFGSMISSPVPLGFYMVMFPHWISPSEWPAISSYRRIVANSAFTAVHVRERWNTSITPVVMIPPPHPISERVAFENKRPMILNVGRFNVRGHNKHQLEAIKSFCQLQQSKIIPNEWRLVVVGNVNDSADNRQYVEQCRQAASRSNVEIIENAPFERLEELYEQATMLWQFTGCDLDWGRNPEQCEHLGLVALDCFAYGVVPLIYQRSGMSYVLRHGIDGFVFGNDDELSQIMSIFVGQFKGKPHQHMFDRCRALTRAFDEEVFRDHLERVIVSASSEVRYGASIG